MSGVPILMTVVFGILGFPCVKLPTTFVSLRGPALRSYYGYIKNNSSMKKYYKGVKIFIG